MKKEDVQAEMNAVNGSVKKILNGFKNNIKSLLYYFNTFEGLAQDADRVEAENIVTNFKDLFSELGAKLPSSKEDKEGIEKLEAYFTHIVKESPEKLTNALIGFSKKSKMPTRNFEIFSRGSFIMLNNYFEYLLADLLSYYYNKHQGSLADKKFEITLKELNEYDTIEEAVKAFIGQKVEAMLAGFTFDELLEHFEDTLKISNEKTLINWKLLIECRERRHLIVHNASRVNKKYLSRTDNQFNLKVNDIVHVDKEYFLNACNEYYLAGLLLSYNCWGKWDGKEATSCISNILDESFDLLQNKSYEMTSKLTEFATENIEGRTPKQQDYLARIDFNRLLSFKKLGKKAELNKELKKIKTGTMAPIFQLVHAILSDENAKIIPLVRQVKLLGHIDLEDYETWPIFDFVRENPTLHEAAQKELGLTTIATGGEQNDGGEGDNKPELDNDTPEINEE